MIKSRKTIIQVQGAAITILNQKEEDFISLTDIAKHREPERTDHIIQNWMRNRNTIEFLGIWEQLHNPDFNPLEFEGIKTKAGLNSFVLTPRQWIDTTRAMAWVSYPPQGVTAAPTPIKTSPLNSPPGYRSSSGFI